MGTPQISHPDFEAFTAQKASGKEHLEPIYSSTEKLKARGLNGSAIAKFTFEMLQKLFPKDLPENLPETICTTYKLMSRYDANKQIHFPASSKHYEQALRRLKFEELFFGQMRVHLVKLQRHRFSKGWAFDKVGSLFTEFYNNNLPGFNIGTRKID